MNFNNDEEALDFFNRLLDRLRQAGYDQHGSHFQLVYVAPGAQHVDTVQNQYLYPAPSPAPHRGGENVVDGKPAPADGTPATDRGGELPEVLATDGAMALWRKAQQAGYVDEHFQPLLSRTQAALLAHYMAKKLEIKDKWKTFEMLWNRRNMYRDYYDAMNQDQTYLFLDKLKELFE